MDLRWNVEYCTEQVTKELNKLNPIVTKLYTVPAEPLTIEERYLLRESLISIESQINLINMDLAQEPPKKNRFKKLFHRK